MSPTTVGIIGIVTMLAIFMTKMPVAYVMTMIGFLGFGYLISFSGSMTMLPSNFYDSFSSYELTTIPLFVLMGQLAFNGGISRKLYNTAYSFLGNIKGGWPWQRSPPARPLVRCAGPVLPRPPPWPRWACRR